MEAFKSSKLLIGGKNSKLFSPSKKQWANKTNAHTCEICKKEFAGPKTLKIHQRFHSKVKDDTTEESEKKPEIIKRKQKSDSVLQQPEVCDFSIFKIQSEVVNISMGHPVFERKIQN